LSDAILDCSKRGGIILDAFAGSGTTLFPFLACATNDFAEAWSRFLRRRDGMKRLVSIENDGCA
jgi:hypothetical protein